MPDFSHTRRWWPACLQDEMMPPGRARPEDWPSPDEAGVTTIRWDDTPDAQIAGTLSPGETVAFVWFEERGRVEITVMPDGSWELDDPRDAGTIDMFSGKAAPPPPAARIEDANWFAEPWDWETMASDMAEFAAHWAAGGMVPAEGERVTVDMGFWSDEVRFTVSADGRSLTAGGGNG